MLEIHSLMYVLLKACINIISIGLQQLFNSVIY